MGLDITAIAKAMRIGDVSGNYDWELGHVAVHQSLIEFSNNPTHFPGAPRAEGLQPGIYAPGGDRIEFKAGSYTGYNEWRDHLARLVGWGSDSEAFRAGPPPAGSPKAAFYELINFADNEGYIGPKVAAKLAYDFSEWAPRATVGQPAWFVDGYGKWRKAFELAADGGLVDFH